MKPWDSLNDKQLAVLRQIADHPDAPLAAGTNVTGLQNRRLVVVRRRDGSRWAEVTSAGRHYLDHGVHPDNPSLTNPRKVAAGKAVSPAPIALPPPSGQPEVPVVMPQQVLEQLEAEGDRSFRICPTSHAERDRWRQAVRRIREQQLTPDGFHIRYSNQGLCGIRIWLEPGDDPHQLRRAQSHVPVRVPDRVHRHHQAVVELREGGRLSISKSAVPRALRILHAVATEAERRGYGVEALQGKQQGLDLGVKGFTYPVSIGEEKDRVPHDATAYERKEMQRSSWFRVPEWDYVASGRLVLALPSTGRTNRYRFSDTKRRRVDQKLADLFAEIEARAITDQQRREEAERKAAALRAEWEEVRQRAIARLEEDHRASWLDQQVTLWRKAKDIRDYVHERRAGRKLTGTEAAWLDWASTYADGLMLRSTSGVPPPMSEPDPRALAPYMEGWSPYEPRPPYRFPF